MKDDATKVLVVGGGVAGPACAIELRHRGLDVTLAERESFPRLKVCGCCLGGAGIAMLDQAGVLPQVKVTSSRTTKWQGYFDSRVIELESGQGIAVSREHLDPILLSEATRLGTEVLQPCEAVITSENSTGVDVNLRSGNQLTSRTFDVVVIASGLKSGNVGGRLPWIEKPNGPFGISVMATSNVINPGVIYMACDDEGYVGLVQLADGRVDVAAALRASVGEKSKSPIQRVWDLLDRNDLHLDLQPIGQALTTPPLRRTRQSGMGRVIAIGDAAGYVEPFTGEGMTWGLQSGREAAAMIADHPADEFSSLGDHWTAHTRTMLAAKKRTCRVLTTAIRSRVARQVAARTLNVFPSLANPLVKQLARP